MRLKRDPHPEAQVLLFPSGDRLTLAGEGSEAANLGEVVISGSYRKDLPGLKAAFEELKDLGFRVLSPSSVEAVSEEDGFVYMKGETTQSPEELESRHLEAINRSQFVWLHAPDGYIGPSAALEVGYAHAARIPIYSRQEVRDPVLGSLVRVIASPTEAAALAKSDRIPPPVPATTPFQEYYARAALRRGYEKESAQNCLLLMLEEFGELARALRKREKLARTGPEVRSNEADELADVFIYVVHMANILGLNLDDIVQSKEKLNVDRFKASLVASAAQR